MLWQINRYTEHINIGHLKRGAVYAPLYVFIGGREIRMGEKKAIAILANCGIMVENGRKGGGDNGIQ